MRRTLLFLSLILYLSATLQAQVTISPTSLFINAQQRFATLLILNGTNAAQEISIEYLFGYPQTNNVGEITMNYDDPEMAARYSAAEWVRGFPKRFILQPGQRQVVRITVRPPRDLDDGVYWARVKTTSNSLVPDVGTAPPGGVTAQINFQFEQITSLFYKQGETTTGLEILDVWSEQDEKSVTLLAQVDRTGNSPFLGSFSAEVQDASGSVVKNHKVFVAIYQDGVQRLILDTSDLPKGEYTADITFATIREDIPTQELVTSPPVSHVAGFTLN